MDSRTFERLVRAASSEGRAGDILFLALRSRDVPAKALYIAARYLRDLMAYSGAIEVCDRVLELDSSHYMALELRALCRGRLREDLNDRYCAASDLDRAIQLAQGQGEAPALIGRLFKQAWVESWLRGDSRPEPGAVAANREAALRAIDQLLLAVDAYEAAFVQSSRKDAYPGINALTLASVARSLLGPQDPRTAEVEGVVGRHRAALAKRVSAAIASAKTTEARYWALVTKAEWGIVVEGDGADEGAAGRVTLLRTTLGTAISLAKHRLFWLDSTIQQFRLLRALGIGLRLVDTALDVLEHAWRSALHPDVPPTRIVFLHLPEEGQARKFDPAWLRAAFDSTIEKSVEAHGDCIALLSGARADILFASVCRDRGIPFTLFLPHPPHPPATGSGGSNEEWHRALEGLVASSTPQGRHRGATAPVELMDRSLGLTPAAAKALPKGSLQCWLLDAARVYGSSRVVVVGLEGFDRDGAVARTVEAIRQAGGTVHRIDAPAATTPGGKALSPPSIRGVMPAAPPAEAQPSLPAPPPMEPLWLVDLCGLLASRTPAKTHERWKSYERNPLAWSLLSSLRLRFEPVEQLSPPAMADTTTGFEVMGMTEKSEPYSELLAKARVANVDPVDLDVTIFAYSLLTVRLLREHLRNQIGGRATWPVFTLNLNEGMLRSPAIDVILEHYFDPALKNRIIFELSETFPEGLLGIGNLTQRHQQIRQAIGLLRKLAGIHGFLVILDDSMRIDPGLRSALQELAYGTKADALFVADVFGLAESSADALCELQRYRVGSKPYVLEGIEKPDHYDFIRSNWPADGGGPVGMQGWIIKVHEPFASFFEPLHTPEEPRGFRLTADVIARVGPR